MKKITRPLLALSASAFFVVMALGSGSSSNSSSNSTEATAKTEAQYNKIGDQVTVDNFTYKVNSMKYAKTLGNNEYTKKTADGIFIVLNVTLTNNGKSQEMVDNTMFKLSDAAGREYEYSVDGVTALETSGDESLFLKEFNPGITKSGIIVFEVPKQDNYDLHVTGGLISDKTSTVKL